MSLDEILTWCRELEWAIGHPMAAHGDHWKTEKDAVRLHDNKRRLLCIRYGARPQYWPNQTFLATKGVPPALPGRQ